MYTQNHSTRFTLSQHDPIDHHRIEILSTPHISKHDRRSDHSLEAVDEACHLELLARLDLLYVRARLVHEEGQAFTARKLPRNHKLESLNTARGERVVEWIRRQFHDTKKLSPGSAPCGTIACTTLPSGSLTSIVSPGMAPYGTSTSMPSSSSV